MPVSAKGRCGRKIVTGPENHEKWEHWRPSTRRYELEPCAVKVARTVLRGEWHSDVLLLPDRVTERDAAAQRTARAAGRTPNIHGISISPR